MEGAGLSQERAYDRSIAEAWHGARFNALVQNGKLRDLASYLTKRNAGGKSSSANAIAFFHAMKEAGLPVTITKVPRKEPASGGNRQG